MKSQMFAPFVALLALAAGASSPRAAADDGTVPRGAYLVAIAACAGCHTPRGPDGPGPALSGGRVFGQGPNAAISANITPDRETGIGTWTDAQIATAIHAGTRPDGSRMGAPMPQIAYRAMRDDDVRAIVAYLRSVPAVANAVPHATRTVPTPRAMPPATMAGDDPVARGRYLANAVTHCTECHTPGPPDAPDFAARLDAGGRVFQSAKGPLVAPPITAESLRRFSDAELGTMIAKGRRPDGSTIEGPMPVAAYAHLTPADLDAIIAYLRKG